MDRKYKSLNKKLKAIGIDTSPESYGFIRYYPPLDTLRKVGEGERPDFSILADIKGKLSLFVYIPFCTGACKYCFYVKNLNPSKQDIDGFLDSLERQAKMSSGLINGKEINSIYIGGGTPSVLDADQLSRLFATIGNNFNLSDLDSFTFESGPDTLTLEKIWIVMENGAKRISMGVQSLDNDVLASMERRYDSEEAGKKIRMLKENCPVYNLDFIYGYPGQDMGDVKKILELVREIEPPSVTFYQKWAGMKDCLGPVNGKANEEGSLPSIIEMREAIEKTMEELGYGTDSLFRYVKDASSGCGYCRTVWEDNSCLALGPSAYSYINGLAFQNERSIKKYQELLDKRFMPVERMKILTPVERASRAFILGLKTAGRSECGVDAGLIGGRYGVRMTGALSSLLDKLAEAGALEKSGSAAFFTREGSAFAEAVLNCLMEKELFEEVTQPPYLNGEPA